MDRGVPKVVLLAASCPYILIYTFLLWGKNSHRGGWPDIQYIYLIA
jgi:hypothetical protein